MIGMCGDKPGCPHYIYDVRWAVLGVNFFTSSQERDLAMNCRRLYATFSALCFILATAGAAHAQADYDAFATLAGTYHVPTQGKLQATVEGSKVELQADGQEAIDWLVGANAEVQARHRHLNSLVVSLMGEMIAGGDVVRRHVLPDPARSADITRLFAVYTDALGTPKHFYVIGTAPRADGSRQTYVRVTFEERTMHLRFSWHSSMLNTITRSPMPTFEASCSAQADLMNCTMLDEQTIALRRDNLGAVSQLVQAGENGAVAYRAAEIARQ